MSSDKQRFLDRLKYRIVEIEMLNGDIYYEVYRKLRKKYCLFAHWENIDYDEQAKHLNIYGIPKKHKDIASAKRAIKFDYMALLQHTIKNRKIFEEIIKDYNFYPVIDPGRNIHIIGKI